MIWIDDNACIVCGKCAEACPEGFAMEQDRVGVKDPAAPCVAKAMAVCPVNAIRMDRGVNPSTPEQDVPSPGAVAGRGLAQGRGSGMGRGQGRGSGMGRRGGGGRGQGGGRSGGRGGGRGR